LKQGFDHEELLRILRERELRIFQEMNCNIFWGDGQCMLLIWICVSKNLRFVLVTILGLRGSVREFPPKYVP
jgi:hypothetical protein